MTSGPTARATPDLRPRHALTRPRLGWLRHAGLPLVMILFAIWGAAVIPRWRWQINTDGVSYLSVARKYLAGDLADAVNAYWSPLYSWLLAILIAAGIEPLLATKVLAVLIGEAVLVTAWWLSAHLGITRDVRLLVGLTLCPILIHFGMTLTTPDLLMTGVILLYLAQMTSARFERRWRGRALSGALGGVAYLAKAYALHFVLLHFTLVNLVDVLRSRGDRRIVCAVVAGYLGLLLVAGGWVACLTAKYGYLTTGSVGQFSLAWNGPGFRIPMFSQGFLPPSDAHAVSAWDDPTSLRFERWNPLATAADRAHLRANLARNWSRIVRAGLGFTLLLWPILIGGVACLFVARDAAVRRSGFVVLSALLLFPIGYSLLHVHDRFLSLACVILLLVGAWVVTTIAGALGRASLLRVAAAVVLCASFLYVPGWEAKLPPLKREQARHSLVTGMRLMFGRWSVAHGWMAGRRFAATAELLRGRLPVGARVASGNHWDASLFLSHHLGLRYWGTPAPGSSPEQVREDLQSRRIEYFWFWGDASEFPFVARWQRIRVPRREGFLLYRVPAPDAGETP